jgi:hypothetical protein
MGLPDQPFRNGIHFLCLGSDRVRKILITSYLWLYGLIAWRSGRSLQSTKNVPVRYK